MNTISLRIPLLALAMGLSLSAAGAQTVIKLNGQIYDGKGGPFKAGNVYWIKSDAGGCCGVVPQGKTLTIANGAIVKFEFNSLTVQGTLNATGAIFTSLNDDSVGGDTNGNGGATTPARGDWSFLDFSSTATGTIRGCTFKFGGKQGAPTLKLVGAQMTLDGVIVRDGGGPGIDGGASPSYLRNSRVVNCVGTAVTRWTWYYCERLANNSASGNGGDYVQLISVSLPKWSATSVTMTRSQTMNSNNVHVLQTGLPGARVLRNHKLTIAPGSIVKFMPRSYFYTIGNMQARGTSAAEVAFTSIRHDIGGDTNKDGATTKPMPGDWFGLRFNEYSDASVIEHAQVSYGGDTTFGGISIVRAPVTIRSTTISDSMNDGLTTNTLNSQAPTVTECDFVDNGGVAASNLLWKTVAGSKGCRASGNKGGDYFRLHFPVMMDNLKLDIRPENYPGPAIVLRHRVDFRTGSRLTLHAGVIVKMEAGGAFANSRGWFSCRGTSHEPVVLTSLKDDAHGGDTNKDGNATAPAPGDWSTIGMTSGGGIFENALVRYAGRWGATTITTGSYSQLSLLSTRIEHVAGDAIQLWSHSGVVQNLVVLKAAGRGLNIATGTFDVHHATITGCGKTGLSVGGGYKGHVHNSIFFNNTGGEVVGLKEAQMHNSVGAHSGRNGNLVIDPRFVNAAAGDLTLATNSPCLGKAGMTVALATKRDHDWHSRILDHALTGTAAPDMGAYERHPYSLEVTGEPRIGKPISFKITGPAGHGQLFLGILNGEAYLPPFGFILLGLNPIFPVDSRPVGTSTNLVIPNVQSTIGAKFGMQGIAVPTAKPNAGAVTNLYRGEVR